MITESGLVKILDFGLAKLTECGEVTEDVAHAEEADLGGRLGPLRTAASLTLLRADGRDAPSQAASPPGATPRRMFGAIGGALSIATAH